MEQGQFRLKIEVGAKLARTAGVAQAAESLLFELADALTSQAKRGAAVNLGITGFMVLQYLDHSEDSFSG